MSTQDDIKTRVGNDTIELYDDLTDAEARRLGRELLELTEDGLKLDHRNGQIVIGDKAIRLRLYPDGVDDAPVSEFRYEFLDDGAEGWWIEHGGPFLELAWWTEPGHREVP